MTKIENKISLQDYKNYDQLRGTDFADRIQQFIKKYKCTFLYGRISNDGKMSHSTVVFEKSGVLLTSFEFYKISRDLKDTTNSFGDPFYNKALQIKTESLRDLNKDGVWTDLINSRKQIGSKQPTINNSKQDEIILKYEQIIANLRQELNNSKQSTLNNSKQSTLNNSKQSQKFYSVCGTIHSDDYDILVKKTTNTTIGANLKNYIDSLIKSFKSGKALSFDPLNDSRHNTRPWVPKNIACRLRFDQYQILLEILNHHGITKNTLIKQFTAKNI